MISSETAVAGVAETNRRGIETWFTARRFLPVLALFVCATFPDVVTGRATFFYRDFGAFTYPIAHYYRECFWRGELPLWNPLNDCGLPLLAQWNTAVLYPPSLFYLLFPLSWSLGVFQIGHLVLAGMGAYFLARRWTGNSFAAAVAGVAFAFNGLSWHMLAWISNLAAWAWMPWVVLSVETACRAGGGRRISLAALAGAMQMLTGSPEIILLTWLWICAAVAFGKSPWIQRIGRMLVIVALVTGLAAAQLLPFLDLIIHSSRSAGFSDSGWAMPASGWANFLVPLFRCFASGQGVYVQNDQYWTPSYYIGIGIIALALLAVWRVRDKRVLLLASAGIFGFLMALGTRGGIYSALRVAFPQVGFMRYPIKFITLTLFALPFLAAYGSTWILSAEPVRARRGFATIAAMMVLGIVAIVAWAWKHPLGWDDWAATWKSGAVRVLFLALIFGAFFLMRKATDFRPRLISGFCVLALLWADVFTHAPAINPTVARGVYEPGLMRAQLQLEPQSPSGDFRVMPTAPAIEKARRTYLKDPAQDYLCRRLALFDNCNLLDGIPKTDGFFSVYLQQYDQVLSFLFSYDRQGSNVDGLKDFLGIARINAPLTQGDGLDWANRSSALPLVTAGQRPVFADGAAALTNMLRPDFDPRTTVFLPSQTHSQVTATNRVAAQIAPGQFSAQKITFEVGVPAPALVTVAQSYYHNWNARVDGHAVPLWRANHAFQALEVPAGSHQVTLVYCDNYFLAGAIVSIISLLVCSLALRRPSMPCPA